MSKSMRCSAGWRRLRSRPRSIFIVCAHALVFAVVCLSMVGFTVGLMGNLIGDMGGSEITDPSGKKYLGFIYALFWLFAVVMSWPLLVPLAFAWAIFFEFLRTRSVWWHRCVMALLG